MGDSDSVEETEVRLAPGFLSQIELSQEDIECFVKYLQCFVSQSQAKYLYSALGSDHFIEFYDIMQGSTVRVPSRKTLVAILEKVKIYDYVKSRDFTEEAYHKASKLFHKREKLIEEIVDKLKTMEEDNG